MSWIWVLMVSSDDPLKHICVLVSNASLAVFFFVKYLDDGSEYDVCHWDVLWFFLSGKVFSIK